VRKAATTSWPEPVDFIFDPDVSAECARLQQHLTGGRRELADFELRHGMSFDEFRARVERDPDAPLGQEFWAWLRISEACRETEAALARLEARRLRFVLKPAGPDSEEERNA